MFSFRWPRFKCAILRRANLKQATLNSASLVDVRLSLKAVPRRSPAAVASVLHNNRPAAQGSRAMGNWVMVLVFPVGAVLPPQVDHAFVALQRQARIGTVGGGEDVAPAARHALPEGAQHVRLPFRLGAGLEQAAVDIADQADVIAHDLPHLGDGDTALGVQRMDGVGLAVGDLLQNGHHIAVGVLDGVVAELAVFVDALLQPGDDELVELVRPEEGVGVSAYTTSNVFKGSGLSSSAAFEVMVGNILRTLCGNDISDIEIAKIAQYSENVFFGKPCGLMDQMACAVGGFIGIDFEDPKNPIVTKPDFDLSAKGYSLCIINTGGNHADLNDDYASVPAEMKAVARLLGKEVLRQTNKAELMARMPEIREKLGDRALLRAIHFLNENERVAKLGIALEKGDLKEFFAGITASGNSSFKYLQNVYTVKNVQEQGLSLALALAEEYLQNIDQPCACRVHGGGFAGTIQVFLPEQYAKGLCELLDPVFGEGATHILRIRNEGAICTY